MKETPKQPKKEAPKEQALTSQYPQVAVLNRIAELIVEGDPNYSKLADVFTRVSDEYVKYIKNHVGEPVVKFKLPG